MQRTTNLDLALLQPAQAAKHIVVNESLLSLDATTQLRLSGRDLTAPPANRVAGATYATAEDPSGDWAGQAHCLAIDLVNQWRFIPLQPGFCATDITTLDRIVWTGSSWQLAHTGLERVDRLGIGADAAVGQALTVEGASALFNADGTDFRQALNRNTDQDVCSVLFQTDFQTNAEIGLVGDDRLSLRCFDTNGQASEHLNVSAAVAGVESAAYRSLIIDVDKDAVASVATPRASGILAIASSHPTFPQMQISGIFAYDTGQSPQLLTLAIQSGVANRGTNDFTTTAGQDSLVSISAGTGQIYINNRFGNHTFACTFIC
jgi:hypothetical protein